MTRRSSRSVATGPALAAASSAAAGTSAPQNPAT